MKTSCEERLVNKLKSRLDSSIFLPFVPVKDKFFRKKGTTTKEKELCFPGYVFVESELDSDCFIVEMSKLIRTIDEIRRIVDYGDKRNVSMHENEREQLKNLFGSNYCIEGSIGFVEGDKVRIINGPLTGVENVIKKINRHKREAIVEIMFMGSIRQMTLGLEIIEKI